MSQAETKPTATSAGPKFRAYYALAALVAGLIAGMLAGRLGEPTQGDALAVASFVGTLWLNALKMTVIPLVVALLIVGIARSAEAAQGGRIAARTVMWIVVVCTASAAFGALLMLLLTHFFPLSRETALQLQAAVAGVEHKASGPLPGAAEFFMGVIPSNVIAAASNGDVLPLTVFAVLFALALTRIAAAGRRTVIDLFEAIGDTLVVIIRWVLWIAPLGIFGLAVTVGSAAGGAAFAGLGHYIVLISAVGILWMIVVAYPLAISGGRIAPALFVRSMLGPQAVAVSTRSSLACLPAMLASAGSIGVREQVSEVALPLSVALLRATGPAMNVGVAFYVAHWLHLEPSAAQMIAATAVGAVMSYGAISLPGEITFISSIAPIAMALGVPIAPLALLVAVEMIPDIFRTLGNVTFDVAVTAIVGRDARATLQA